MCLRCLCFLPYKSESCRGALQMSSFPFSSPCLLSCSIRLSLHHKHHVVKSLCRHCPFLLVEKRSSCFMVAWRLQSCLLPGLLQCSQQSAWLQGQAQWLSSASTLTLQHLFPSPHKPEHRTSSKVSAKNHLARLSFSLKNELCFTFPLSCWENVKSG